VPFRLGGSGCSCFIGGFGVPAAAEVEPLAFGLGDGRCGARAGKCSASAESRKDLYDWMASIFPFMN